MNRTSIHDKVKAYKLDTQIIIIIVLLAVLIGSVLLYLIPDARQNPIINNLLLALFTSVLVSIFTLVVDVIVEINKQNREKYLTGIREFGIGNLYLNKEELLKGLIEECDNKIWISGYRLILTNNLKQEIYEAIKRGADFRAVICPPWSEAFKMVYGSDEEVLNNYLQVFNLINEARKETGKNDEQVEVVFVNKPIFSDTYRVDQRLVTGPYMHNKDKKYGRLMAKDFFSYDIVRKSELSALISDEYETLYREAEKRIDWNRFDEVYNKIYHKDLRESEKIKVFSEVCCVPVDN